VLVLPAAWVKGPLKEHHWATLLAARALDTTCYIVAAGECGNKNIGQSRVVDPLGVTVAAAAEAPTLLMTEIFSARIALRASNYLFSQSSVCATAIILMFFQQCLIHLVTDCYCVRASNDR
jgi:predicted amidohydrolase